MNQAVVTIVDLCVRRWRAVIAVGTLVLLASALYAAARFSINTDIETLVAQNLPWHQRQVELSHSFPQRGISVVVTAPTPEDAEIATDELAAKLKDDPKLFHQVVQPDSGNFFERDGLLLGSVADVQQTAEGLSHARPLLQALAADPTLRGSVGALGLAAQGVAGGRLKLEQLGRPLSLTRKLLDDVLAGRPAFFSWQELLQGHTLSDNQSRHFIEVAPQLDFNALQPGQAASQKKSGKQRRTSN